MLPSVNYVSSSIHQTAVEKLLFNQFHSVTSLRNYKPKIVHLIEYYTEIILKSVASNYLSMSVMIVSSPCKVPYLKVINSGCLFLLVIFMIAVKLRLTLMRANPGRSSSSLNA